MKLLYGSILAGLAANFVAAAPSGEKKLSPRERAGLPVAKHVSPIKARSTRQFTDLTPVGAPYERFIGAAQADEGLGIGPIVDTMGTALNAAKGIEYIIDAEISGSNYTLIIDTGSTDTWIVAEPFECFDVARRIPVDVAQCRFGPYFDGEPLHGLIDGQTFNISYGFAGGPFLEGVMAYSDIKVAGVHLQKQQLALAQKGAWRGDSISSGILGLGLPSLTAALDQFSRQVEYDGFVTTMISEGVEPIFALALSRNKSESFLSFGGVPDVETDEYATAPILRTIAGSYSRYVIAINEIFVEGLEVSNSTSVTEPVPIQTPFLIDSGTTLNIFPPLYAKWINMAFEPPAVWDADESLYFADCDATPPLLTFDIGGMNITTDLDSMILPDLQKNGKCATGITTMGGGEELYILGDTFMQELVVVFDISDNMEIRVANRK